MKALHRYVLAAILLSIVAGEQVFAQKRPKYEDELTRILNSAPSEGLALLKIYLAEDPANPSIHLQMGLIYEKRFRQANVLTEYQKAIGNAQGVVNSLEKASQLIEERVVKRNKEQYINFAVFDQKGKYDVPFDSVRRRIDKSLLAAKEFLTHVPGIYSDFTASFTHYQEAQKIFTSLVGQYKNLKDLYLLYDGSLENELDKMSDHYDLAIRHFEAYKTATAKYPIKGYDQKTKLQEIVIYRLDGLEVEINFLLPEIRIWNYKKWANEVKAYTAVNITKLRADLASNEVNFNSRLKSIRQEFDEQKYEPLKTNKETMFNLKKYDLVSVIEPLFLYKEAKHDLLYNKLMSSRLDSGTEIAAERRLFLYGQMINRIREADSILTTVKVRNTPESYQKYKPFLDKHYRGMDGIVTYVNSEQLDNRRDFMDYIGSLRSTLLDQYTLVPDDEKVTHKKVPYTFNAAGHPEDSLVAGLPVTTHVLKNFDGSTYLGGVQRNAREGKLEAFLIKLDRGKKVLWLKNLLLQRDSLSFDADTRMAVMQATQEGVVMILNGIHVESGEAFNHLLIVDEAGEVLTTRRLMFSEFPRGIFYHERTNSYLAVFKGERHAQDLANPTDLILASHNILGDLKWQYRTNYAGTFEGMTGVEDGFILAGNFSTIRAADGKLIRGGKSPFETAPVLIKVDFAGRQLGSKPMPGSTPYYGKNLIRISDLCLNLVGGLGNYVAAPLLKENIDNAFHIIFDSKLNIISSSVE